MKEPGLAPEVNRLRKELFDTKAELERVRLLIGDSFDYFVGELADDPANEMADKLATQLRQALGYPSLPDKS